MAKSRKFAMPCVFGGVSPGLEIASLSVKIQRANLELMTADDLFSGRQLQVKITTVGDPEQGKLVDDLNEEIEGVVDVNNYSVNGIEFGTRLKFKSSAVSDGAGLLPFRKKTGTLTILKVLGKIESDEESPDED